MKYSFKFSLFFFLLFSLLLNGREQVNLSFSNPDEVGMDAEKLKLVDQKMDELIKENRLSGGIVVVARKGKVVHFETYGKSDLENDLPVEKDMIFSDLFDDQGNFGRSNVK